MATSALPPDDPSRTPTLADPERPNHRHVAVFGDVYTILVSGDDTAGCYALIDMEIPAGGGVPPHRHAFEELFHVLEGELEVNVRGVPLRAPAGVTVNVPALAPHSFTNRGEGPVRFLCLAAPAGLERFFAELGEPVASRRSPPPELGPEEQARRLERAVALTAEFGIELL